MLVAAEGTDEMTLVRKTAVDCNRRERVVRVCQKTGSPLYLQQPEVVAERTLKIGRKSARQMNRMDVGLPRQLREAKQMTVRIFLEKFFEQMYPLRHCTGTDPCFSGSRSEQVQQQTVYLRSGERSFRFRSGEDAVHQQFDSGMPEADTAFRQTGGEVIFRDPFRFQFNVEATRKPFGFQVIMRFLPVVKQQIAGRAVVAFFPVAFQYPSLKNKGEIGIFVVVPVDLRMGIFRVREVQAPQLQRLVGHTEKLTGRKQLHPDYVENEYLPKTLSLSLHYDRSLLNPQYFLVHKRIIQVNILNEGFGAVQPEIGEAVVSEVFTFQAGTNAVVPENNR